MIPRLSLTYWRLGESRDWNSLDQRLKERSLTESEVLGSRVFGTGFRLCFAALSKTATYEDYL